MMRPFRKRTSRQDRTKPITPSCREFNSASDGVCFIKQFIAVIVLQHQKQNQVQSFTLTNLDRVNHEFDLIATYPSYSKVFRAIANKFSSLRKMILGSEKACNHNPFAKSSRNCENTDLELKIHEK